MDIKKMEEICKTIEYYNRNASLYFDNTVKADLSECYEHFLKYIGSGGRIIDIGAGSGRDVKYFKDRGYVVEAIDAAEEMCRLASDYSGVVVRCESIYTWQPEEKYDGMWANASLLHIPIAEIEDFIFRVSNYLNLNGVFYISMKSGVQTGYDDSGRFFTNFSEDIMQKIVAKCTMYKVAEIWETEDSICREGFRWLNFILKRL